MSSKNILKAIQEINSDAMVTIYGSDIDTCTFIWHEGITPISKDDIKAKMAELPTEEEELAQIETNKSSGKQKLKDLGLTDAEIKALTGA